MQTIIQNKLSSMLDELLQKAAESIVKLADTETQIIQLIVSEKDKTLRLA